MTIILVLKLFPKRLRQLAKVRLRVAFHRARYKVWHLCAKSLVEYSCRVEPSDKNIPSTNREFTEVTICFTY
jgi:hypothetical protein